MKILVSKCLLGENCRYKGDNCKNDKVLALGEKYEIVGVCPEVMGGLPTPRQPGEIVGDRVIAKDGADITAEYVRGAEAALASIGVVQRCAMFTVLPLIGTAVAIQPLLGFNYGAGLIPRVRETVRFGILMATVIGTCMWIMIMLFSGDIVSFFGIRADGLRDFTAFALKVQLLVLPVVGFQIVVGNYFQATGQPMKSIILSLTRQVLFLIPLYIVLPIVLPMLVPALTGLDALYFAVPIADGLSVVTAAAFLAFEMRRLKRVEAGEEMSRFGKGAKHS